MNNLWDIIIIAVAILMFVIMVIIVKKADNQFHDKSLDLIEGMDEMSVMETMEKDPVSIDMLKDDQYMWTFERKDWKGWGTQIITTRVYFNSSKTVIKIERTISYDRSGIKKQ